jgi:hypothetical protein
MFDDDISYIVAIDMDDHLISEVQEWCQIMWPHNHAYELHPGWHMRFNYIRGDKFTYNKTTNSIQLFSSVDMLFDDSKKAMLFILRWGGTCSVFNSLVEGVET